MCVLADDEAARQGAVEDFDIQVGGLRVVFEGVAEALRAGFSGTDGETGKGFSGRPFSQLSFKSGQCLGAVLRFGGQVEGIVAVMRGGFKSEGSAGGVFKEGGVGINFADREARVLMGGAGFEGLGDAADLFGGRGCGVETVSVIAGGAGGSSSQVGE